MQRVWLAAMIAAITACGDSSSTDSARASAESAGPPPPLLVLPHYSGVTAFMGDSITQNWVLANYDTNPTVNFGMSGQTTVQMLARFSILLASGPSIVVIEGGINDLHYLGPNATNIDSIATMAYEAKAAGMRVILCSLVPDSFAYPSGYAPRTADIVSMNEQILLLAKRRGYLYADYYDAMLLPDGSQNVALTIDGLHPNDTGYAYLWNVLEPLLAESAN